MLGPNATALDDPSVTFVSSYGGAGGSEFYLEQLLRFIPSSSVLSVVSLGEGTLSERIRALGFHVDVLPTSGHPWSIASSSLKLRHLLARLRPGVVHANGLKAAIVCVLAKAGTGIPVVWVRHDFSWEGWRARTLASRCRRVICVSEALTRTFPSSMANKIAVVHTGIQEMAIEREDARRRVLALVGDDTPGPIVSLVGHLVPGKGHLELAEITPGLFEASPDARVLFIGAEPSKHFHEYGEAVRERINGLGPRVTFLGHRDDVDTFVAGSDVVVMPSVSRYRTIETEGFPMLALEALSVGTPVVAYAVGGLPELLADCGRLVEPGDQRALLRAILQVVTDRSRWERLSSCGRERARRSFDVSDMVKRIREIYRLAAR